MKMKKEYTAPAMYPVELKDDIAIIGGSNNVGTGGADTPDEDPNGAAPSKGNWGDLWT